MPGPANAAEGEAYSNDGAYTRRIDERTPYWGLEVRLDPYKPLISNNAKVQELYSLVYENPDSSLFKNHPMEYGVEFDWYPMPLFDLRMPLPGIIGIYARVAYWKVTGATRLCVDANNVPTRCTSETVFASTKGNDTGSLAVLPVSLGLVYRLDSIRRNTGFPLVFNFKAGFDYYIWWATSGAGASHYDGQLARGGTLAGSLSAGVSLGLDAFGGQSMAGRGGTTRSAIFAEYQVRQGKAIAGSNRSQRLDFTDNLSIIVGLELEFL